MLNPYRVGYSRNCVGTLLDDIMVVIAESLRAILSKPKKVPGSISRNGLGGLKKRYLVLLSQFVKCAIRRVFFVTCAVNFLKVLQDSGKIPPK